MTSSAWAADSTATTSPPHCSRYSFRSSRPSGSSSTTRARTPSHRAIATAGSARPRPGACHSGATGSLTLKVDPLPSPGLLASTWPPCMSTSSRTIARPSPSPPCARVTELSAWRKRSKITGSISRRIPMPVSRMLTVTRDRSRWTRTSMRPCRGENFTAFERRFHMTCWSRSGSPLAIGPALGSSIRLQPEYLMAYRRWTNRVEGRRCTTATRSTGRTSSRIFPLIIRETSRRSSISWDCARSFALKMNHSRPRFTASGSACAPASR